MAKVLGHTIAADDKRIAVLTYTSKNKKTGTERDNMAQLWILPAPCNPIDAHKQGLDKLVCGNCPHRTKGTCYVELGKAPNGVWKAFHRNRYPVLQSDDTLQNPIVRFGAYGDPAFIPKQAFLALANKTKAYTGYTHQWRRKDKQYLKAFCMASCDTKLEAYNAQKLGWRTFRISIDGKDLMPNEILCPNGSRGTKCKKCLLCSGNKCKAKNIVVVGHGPTKNKLKTFVA